MAVLHHRQSIYTIKSKISSNLLILITEWTFFFTLNYHDNNNLDSKSCDIKQMK